MSVYTGNFQVINKTGDTITACVVTHRTTDHGNDTLEVGTLQNGATSAALARVVDLPPGASIPALARVTAHPRRPDRWSIQLALGADPPLSGYATCAIPAGSAYPVHLAVVASPAPRLVIRTAEGGCSVPLL